MRRIRLRPEDETDEPEFVLLDVPPEVGRGIALPQPSDDGGDLLAGPPPWSDVDLGQPGRAVAVLDAGRGG